MIFFALGLAIILIVLADALETIVLPRTVSRSLRLARLYFRFTAIFYRAIGRLRRGPVRQQLLLAFAPVSLLSLIVLWAILLVVGFGMVSYGLHIPLGASGELRLDDYLYYSGVTFFTLGFGDLTPHNGLGRVVCVAEAGTGLGFLALLIGYVPVVYQAVARREVAMLLLDSKAGSIPTAFELLRRHVDADDFQSLLLILKDWERTSAELLESMLSFPFTAHYRSQHDDQSWLGSLTAMLDLSALIQCCFLADSAMAKQIRFQAKATFAMARHTVVDVEYILGVTPVMSIPRLTENDLKAFGFVGKKCLVFNEVTLGQLGEMRAMYEPNVAALARDLIIDLPPWVPVSHVADNWQTSAWDAATHF